MSVVRTTPDRLTQIASKKLASLGIAHQLSASTEGLIEGELAFSPGVIVNPINGLPLGRARFVTVEHDKLRFVDAPLAALGVLPFYEAKSVQEIELAIAKALSARRVVLQHLRVQFENLKLKTRLDPDGLAVVAEVMTPECRFLIDGGPHGVRVRAIAEGGKAVRISEAYPPLTLADFPTGVDLELYLCDRLPEIRAAAENSSPRRSSDSLGVVLQHKSPPPGSWTLTQLAERFGPEALFIPGERVEVAQEFTAGGNHYRFAAVHEVGDTFRAMLIGPKGVQWQDKIHLSRFPGIPALVSSALGVPLPAPSQPEQAGPTQPPAESSSPDSSYDSAIPIVAGEVWVMSVMIVTTVGDEVRYACTDVNGARYGALRILARSDFEQVFCPHAGGWRLLIQIERVEGEKVFYRQLNSQRQPGPQLKALARPILVTTFIPEAAAY